MLAFMKMGPIAVFEELRVTIDMHVRLSYVVW